nr:MAG TPA: hypothetical protein [Bacteriophage sp.]
MQKSVKLFCKSSESPFNANEQDNRNNKKKQE